MNTHVEQGRATRQQILAVAADLFAARGYADTSVELVLERSGASRGSLYHHFHGKPTLFEAVLEHQEERIAAATVAAARGARDSLGALRAGCHAWLELAREPAVRQIVLIDAPSVLGWQKWREIDGRYAFGTLRDAVASSPRTRDGSLPVETVAHIILAALIETALVVARADRPQAALGEAEAAIDQLLNGLFAIEPAAAAGA